MTYRSKKPTVAFFPAHPSQVWMLAALAREVREWADVRWYLRDKDVSCAVADALGLEYRILSTAGRGLTGNARELAANIGRVVRETRASNIDCWVSKYGAANVGALLAGAFSISFNDDDYDAVPWVAWTSYPFARTLLAPDVTRMGPFNRKTHSYRSLHELFYLHPARFTPDSGIVEELGLAPGSDYVLIRLSALQAHHDRNIAGISDDLLSSLIARLRPGVKPIISSERALGARFEPLRFRLAPHRIHHALAFAACLVSDSQSMSAEAAVLGTPSLRINDFVGRISYLAELESYGLSFGFKPQEDAEVIASLERLMAQVPEERRAEFASRRARLLANKIDPVPEVAALLRREIDNSG